MGSGGDVTDGIVAAWARELPDIDGPALALAKRVARLAAVLDAATVAQLTALGLTKAEYEILVTLRAAGDPFTLRPSELSARLRLTSGGTSNVLRRLTDTGMVVRDADETDARGLWVRLTPAGAGRAEAAARAVNRATVKLLRDVPPATAESASGHLRDVLIALDDI
ncbi:MarR family transcriptional regulator [Actinokineospora auranticolor]|uniref:DNA-binding MarR family transcriptional regulator n=1 Tax=Actinokineospora auranticolor TaxID=155976 RepID=A0A2S6GIZ3_9PSEU|nr:MarR family transcriptional regulator [Actinokineospora auranticolor]PPK65202.1 DNA-binding MarR family transcriptional regulator [Actinokineospora auranticolor]